MAKNKKNPEIRDAGNSVISVSGEASPNKSKDLLSNRVVIGAMALNNAVARVAEETIKGAARKTKELFKGKESEELTVEEKAEAAREMGRKFRAEAKRVEDEDPYASRRNIAGREDDADDENADVPPSLPKREVPRSSLENLKRELEDARKAYAEEHYKASSKVSLLKRVLPFTKTGVDDVDTVKRAFEKYKEAQNNLLNSEIDDLRTRYESGAINDEEMNKEIAGLIKYYNFSEKISLFEARTDARASAQKGKLLPTLAKLATAAINRYRKMDLKWKMGISAALFATGALGLASAATIASLSLVSRSVASVSTGTGAAVTAEALHRRKEKKISEKKARGIMEELEREDLDKFLNLQEMLSFEIDRCDRDLSRELKSAKNRKLFGLGVGAAVFLLPSLIKWGLHSGLEEHAAGGAEKIVEYAPVEEAGEAVHQATELTIEKGSSVEGTLIKQLVSEGMDKAEAGKMAHRMAAEYANSHNLGEKGMFSLVQPGTQIEYDPTNHKILEIGSEHKMGWLGEHQGASQLEGDVSGGAESSLTNSLEPEAGEPSNLGEPSDLDADYDVAYNEWQTDHQKDIKEFSKLFQKAEALKMEKQSFFDNPYKLDPTDQESMRRFEDVSRGIPNAQYFSKKALAKVVRSIFEGNNLGIENMADVSRMNVAEYIGSDFTPSDRSILRIGALAKNLNRQPNSGEKMDKFIGRLMIALAKRNK